MTLAGKTYYYYCLCFILDCFFLSLSDVLLKQIYGSTATHFLSECFSIQREDARAPLGVSLLLLHPSRTQRYYIRQEGRLASFFNPREIHFPTEQHLLGQSSHYVIGPTWAFPAMAS